VGAQASPEMRKYQETHPWLRFEPDLRRASYRAWMALGDACSKCEAIAGVPLWPSVAKRLQTLFLAKGIRATTAIEGNTLSEEEVRQRLEGKLPLSLSKEYLGREVDNILVATEAITEKMVDGESDELSVGRIKEYNRMVLHGLELEEGVVPGEIRAHAVRVANYTAVPPEDCEYLLGRLCAWVDKSELLNRDDGPIATGILKAILAHLYMVLIHPFGDGNGRTARLIEYQILLGAGVPSMSAHLLSDHYNETREEYYRQLDRVARSNGDVLSFFTYALDGLVAGLGVQLELIRSQQVTVSWRDYVNEEFRGRHGKTQARQRELVLALSGREPVPRQDIRHLTPTLAEAYAGKKDKTVSRDLNKLIEMGLLERTPHGYRAKVETTSAFLPVRRE